MDDGAGLPTSAYECAVMCVHLLEYVIYSFVFFIFC